MKLFVIFLSIFMMAATNKKVSFDSRPVPSYVYPAKTAGDLNKIFKIKFWQQKNLMCFDEHYVGVGFDYFINYCEWFNKFRDTHFAEHMDEAFDCEDFAFAYKTFMSSSVFKKKSLRQILVGVIVVKSQKDFHGVGGKGLHALNVVFTDKGWYVVEPQNGKYTPLEEYTNPIIRYIF